MFRPRITPTLIRDAGAGRPRWLTSGIANLTVLCVLIVAVGMLSPRLSRTDAGVIFVIGVVAFALGAAFFVGATRRITARFHVLQGAHAAADAVMINLRRVGLPLLGLVFFLTWTIVYIGVWFAHPHEAFTGLSAAPRFSDFFYYSVSTAFISPPGDIAAHSRGARSATMVEMLTGFALVATYITSFVDWRPGAAAVEAPAEPSE